MTEAGQNRKAEERRRKELVALMSDLKVARNQLPKIMCKTVNRGYSHRILKTLSMFLTDFLEKMD